MQNIFSRNKNESQENRGEKKELQFCWRTTPPPLPFANIDVNDVRRMVCPYKCMLYAFKSSVKLHAFIHVHKHILMQKFNRQSYIEKVSDNFFWGNNTFGCRYFRSLSLSLSLALHLIHSLAQHTNPLSMVSQEVMGCHCWVTFVVVIVVVDVAQLVLPEFGFSLSRYCNLLFLLIACDWVCVHNYWTEKEEKNSSGPQWDHK